MTEATFEPLVASYYADCDPHLALAPGRICWVPATYVENDYQVAEVAGTVPSDDSATTYKVIRYEKKHRAHPPIFGPRLRATEAMRIARMKYRPAVVISSRSDPWTDRGGTATRHSTDSRLLVPLFTIEEYGPNFIGRVQRFEYNSHFFLPANPLTGGTPDRAVFARFEQTQPMHKYMIDATAFRLEDEVMEYMHSWFEYFCRGTHNEVSALLAQIYDPLE
jgi:hypothetical protein